jgi:hypothetical protein
MSASNKISPPIAHRGCNIQPAAKWVLRTSVLALAVAAGSATAATLNCSSSANSMFTACKYDANDNFWVEYSKCQNLTNQALRNDCIEEARDDNEENVDLCDDQKSARRTICRGLREAIHDPLINPAAFVDPLQIGTSVAPNPYLILTPGYTRVYQTATEIITITVTHETQNILGVNCIVSRDTVTDLEGELIEDTVDFFAQDGFGNVWYFGETTAEYEGGFPVSVDGTFKAGDARAKPGIAMQAMPHVGTLYREEFALGEAEDVAEILSTTASESAPGARCSGTCLLTRNSTPISPDNIENKYYAPGIGEIVAFRVDDPGNREVLVEYHY